jgi:hypothetical protein
MPTNDARQSRRALLLSAAGGAAALAAAQLAKPAAAMAADEPVLRNVDNPTTAETSITQATAGTGALVVNGAGAGAGVSGLSPAGIGVLGTSQATTFGGVIGLEGPTDGSAFKRVEDDPVANQLDTGVYGWANMSAGSSGVFGESIDGAGVVGAGQWGCIGVGWPGIFGFTSVGTGVHGHYGDYTTIPDQPAKTGVFATATAAGTALEVRGKAKFSRSKKASIAKGKSSLKVTLAGVTSASYVIATLQSKRTGTYVQAVVCATGSFTIYLNKAVTATTYVAYFVIN